MGFRKAKSINCILERLNVVLKRLYSENTEAVLGCMDLEIFRKQVQVALRSSF